MEPPVVTIVSYSSGGGARERMDKGTIEKTYEDLIRLVGSDQFICLICERRAVAFGGKAAKILSCKSSGNITVHIAACCPDELTEAHAEQHKTIATRYFAGKATGAGDITAMVRGIAPGDVAAEMALCCLRDSRPFTLVEGTGFRELVAVLNPNVKVPSADTVARAALKLDEVLQTKLTREILPLALGYTALEGVTIPASVPVALYSITTDAWLSRSGDSYITITLHYITADFEMKTHVLALRDFPAPHTAEHHREVIDVLLQENGLVEEYMLTCTTDSASTMIAAMNLEGLIAYVHTRCVAHSLHNGVKEDTFGGENKINSDKVLSAPLKLADYFSSISTVRNAAAAATARELGVPLLKATAHVPTRWGSLHAAFKRHLERWPVIRQVPTAQLKLKARLGEYNELIETCSDNKSYYERMVEMLEPVSTWSERLQASDTPTVPLLFSARKAILASLAPVEGETPKAAALRKTLLTSMTERLNDNFVPIKYPVAAPPLPLSVQQQKLQVRWKQANAAALLDIRTAVDHFPVLFDHFDTLSDYLATCHHNWQRSVIDAPAAPPPAAAAAPAGSMAALLAKKAAEASAAAAAVDPLVTSRAKVAEELGRYPGKVEEAVAGKEALSLNPLQWWRDHKAAFPALAHVARTLLAAQATSAASERVFSAAGFVASNTRSALSVDSLELCVLAKSALKNGIDLREEYRALRAADREAANAKRSASMAAVHAAKRQKVGEGEGGGGGAQAAAQQEEAAAAAAADEKAVLVAEEQVVAHVMALVGAEDGEADF